MNEKNLIRAVPVFLKEYFPDVVVHSHKVYGLLELEPGIVVSPDAVMDITWSSVIPRALVLVEFKTKVAAATLAEAKSAAQTYGPFVACNFNSDECKKLICLEHRVQILHQVAVTGILTVLYVVGSKSCILQIVAVTFEEQEKEDWRHVVRTILKHCAPYILQKDHELQLPDIPTSQPGPKNPYGGCPDKETFLLHLLLHRLLAAMIRERGRPFPTADRIAPFPIPFWNWQLEFSPLQDAPKRH